MGIAVATVSTLDDVTPQIGSNDPNGQQLGSNAAAPIGFFGVTPVARPTGGGPLAGQFGAVTVYGTAQSPGAVSANTTAEGNLTVTGVATGQFIVATKPTSQAGLLVGTARVLVANQVGLTFGNDTSGSITPTAAEVYEFTAIPGNMVSSLALTPVAVAANTTAEQQFPLAGINVGSIVAVNKPSYQAGLIIVGSRAVSAGVIGITYANLTASPITPTAETYLVFSAAGLQVAPVMQNTTAALTPASVAANTTAEQTFTVAGLVSGAPVIVNKPSAQVGLGIAGARASAANTLAINYVNDTGTAIVPAAETYTVAGFFASNGNATSTAYNTQIGSNDHANLVALGLVAST